MLFESDHLHLRRNLWRSLFVLDRFLAASLGRPTAISEEDCPEESLLAPPLATQQESLGAKDAIRSESLTSSVNTSHLIGRILKEIYSKRKTSTSLVSEMVSELDPSMRNSNSALDPRRLHDGGLLAEHAIAILHAQLLSYHSVILLTRPCFLHLLIKTQKTQKISTSVPRCTGRAKSRLDILSEACVATSTRTIHLLQAAHEHTFLSRSNPFAL